MLVPADIIAAKLLGQISSVPTKEIRRTLKEADEAYDSSMDVVARLAEKGLLSASEVKRTRRYVAQFEHVRYEAMFLKKLERVRSVPKFKMYELMAYLEGGSYRRRVGPVLVELGWLSVDQAKTIENQSRKRLLKEDLKVLERYRNEKFKNVSKPLIKQEIVTDEIFRVSLLFHSRDTVTSVNREILKMQIENAEKTFSKETPYTIDPTAAKRVRKQALEDIGQDQIQPIVSAAYVDPDPLGESLGEGDAIAEIITEDEIQIREHIQTARYQSLAARKTVQEKQVENLAERKEIGAYEVMECLGQGGMGAVYMCRDSNNGSMAAVKVMLAHKAKDSDAKRFHREVHITRLLDHKNTIRLIEQGKTADGLDWMGISLCAGKSLKGILKKDGPFEAEVAFHIFEQILEGMESVHQKNIVHRDLKPDNVFVQAGKDRRVTIMDFGIARLMDDHLPKKEQAFRTKLGVVSGSPSYIAPETISGDAIDARTDIYSLGIMFYEMLTGKLPLFAETPYDYLREHLIGIPMTIYQGHRNAYWCSEIEQLMASMLAKEKEDRPASCQLVLDILRGGIRDKTLTQLKDPPKEKQNKSLINSFFKLLGR
jgi:predicted Ser/Thr protein kinase